MSNAKEILKRCFRSNSSLWKNYVSSTEDVNISYYPSAGEDLRPFVFTKKECLEFTGINFEKEVYFEPDLFIFSDYFPFSESRFFDSKMLHFDFYTSVIIEDYCEISPNSENFTYSFNPEYVAFRPSQATGKAIFFRVKITSHVLNEPFYKYGIYFFYENINLIDQLFIRNKLEVSHLIWKRDGSGLGGGRFRHDFLLPISLQFNSRFYFVWDGYLAEDKLVVSNDTLIANSYPEEFLNYSTVPFSLDLQKAGSLRWEKYDRMNLYLRQLQEKQLQPQNAHLITDQI
jgi:hypothetical protein